MSFHLLLKYYQNGELEKFRALLSGGNNTQYVSKGGGPGNTYGIGSLVGGSPGGLGTSPRMVTKNRKVSGQLGNTGSSKGTNLQLSRADINGRDYAGLTILHRAASSTSENAIAFAMALLEHPAVDLYIQDTENGWTALHRALYFGNITLARAIIEKDTRNPPSQMGSQRTASSVIKVKDFEGNSPFDVYNATIARRTLQSGSATEGSDDDSQDENEAMLDSAGTSAPHASLDGDEVFAWGSNRNHGLGFKDQDDRAHPEKINLKRPDHLLFRFYREYLEANDGGSEYMDKSRPFPKSVSDLPTLISNRPIIIQDVALSKLHSAILTTDPESNLYMCGFGPGGRLGTGDETTRFSYVPIEDGALAGKKVVKVALGTNHTLAITSDGSLSSWGTNTYGQLGYTLPRPATKDEEPICSNPRQIFGTLKRESIVGVAASAHHSVAHTSTSLFTWGKNEGQLGLMDSDSRSLEVQAVPRKVASSLFKAPIRSVSAINAATVVLLANHTVFVFGNYGYSIVKFPLYEGFTNYHLKQNALITRYESGSNRIVDITAGGDTIGAISSRGDLFTVTVRKIDRTSTTSTTNPTKIRESLSTPQRVWSLRKGHWDGIKSVGITENGAVILCTHAGAVWQRIRRPNIKDPFTSAGSRKDFKFQRIPGLTKVTAIRSTTFGVYYAIRKDCDVTRTQIEVDERHLWQDLAPLFSLNDLEASELTEVEDSEPRFWKPMLPADLFGSLKRAVLTSPDLEADVARHLLGRNLTGYDFEIGSTTSDVRIPVHGFILARSPVLRNVLEEFRREGRTAIHELLTLEQDYDPSQSIFGGGHAIAKPRLVFQGLDFLAIVNLLVYLYTDEVIDTWHFTRQNPKMAFRYRQIRVELMKTASQLKLTKLESAARLMIQPERQMDQDMDLAIRDPRFFKGGDMIIELDGSEVIAQSSLLCRRCPFFEGIFNGRAGGQWLAGRRQDKSEPVRIDLKHMQPDAFDLILRYLYADVGTELFDDVVSVDIDDFSELVMDVMAAADELMLDRLSQICQQVIGRFVSTRNVCNLLNAIAPCSITSFKDSALEYICLQLESMLENHLLNELQEGLVLQLDEVVRANQLSCLPFAKSGRAELELHERCPTLSEDIHEERQRRLRDLAFRANLKDEDNRLSSSHRARVGSVDDLVSASPSQDKLRRKSRAIWNAPFSPNLRPKDSTIDLMFDMDDEESLAAGSPASKPMLDLPVRRQDSASPRMPWDEGEPRSMPEEEPSSFPSGTLGISVQRATETLPATKTWSSPALPSSKLDMREIMAQTSATRTSALSMSLSAQKAKDEAVLKQNTPKLSQKERKKQQQQILQQTLSQSQTSFDRSDEKPSSPWQVASMGPKTSLRDLLDQPTPLQSVQPAKSLAPPAAPKVLTPRRTASPDTRFAGQARSSNGKGQFFSAGPSGPASQERYSLSSPVVPHSRSYTTPAAKAEPSLQLSMADIIGQQRREQEVIKEAVAKRSLQEIQEEQAFQEWWDLESRRAQEEAARAKNDASGATRGAKSGGNRGKSSGRVRGGRGRGDANRGRGRGRGTGAQDQAPSGRGTYRV